MTVSGQSAGTPGSQLPINLATAAQRIDEALNHNPNMPMALSGQARAELEILHGEYLGDLGQEAVRLARREHLSTVDRTHVLQAADRLGGDSSGVFSNVANSIGGLFAGAGLAAAYSIVFTPGKHSIAEIVVALVFSIIGFVLLAAGVTAMIIRRRT
jgi:histone H3/H4